MLVFDLPLWFLTIFFGVRVINFVELVTGMRSNTEFPQLLSMQMPPHFGEGESNYGACMCHYTSV